MSYFLYIATCLLLGTAIGASIQHNGLAPWLIGAATVLEVIVYALKEREIRDLKKARRR